MLATQARRRMPGEARTFLAALDDERAGSGEIGNARAAISLAEGNRPRLSARYRMYSTAPNR